MKFKIRPSIHRITATSRRRMSGLSVRARRRKRRRTKRGTEMATLVGRTRTRGSGRSGRSGGSGGRSRSRSSSCRGSQRERRGETDLVWGRQSCWVLELIL